MCFVEDNVETSGQRFDTPVTEGKGRKDHTEQVEGFQSPAACHLCPGPAYRFELVPGLLGEGVDCSISEILTRTEVPVCSRL